MADSPEYMIYHPENFRLIDLFSLLILRRKLSSATFVEYHFNDQTKVGVDIDLPNPFITAYVMVIQNYLNLISLPLRAIGNYTEYGLNALNGFAIPNREAAQWRSIMGLMDGRLNLYHYKGPDTANQKGMLDISMMAAKMAYENEACIKDAVTNHWKMRFIGFYNFYYKFYRSNATQAFICCDAPTNAKLIIVSFRGTELYNSQDWSTDVDLSFFTMGDMGRVHLGFMRALGLLDDRDYVKGWPKTYSGKEPLAYYTIRDTLNNLLNQNKGAKIIITGHSLGAALAALFPSVLALHKEDAILSNLFVYTYGQPRVGDKNFGDHMNKLLMAPTKRYNRVVYRFDLVPRVPPDDAVTQFAHFGDCLYFSSWDEGSVMKQEPNQNAFNPMYIGPQYANAWGDLARGLTAGVRYGLDFQESITSIYTRVFGLMVPGFASHSPRDTVNSIRLAKITNKVD